MNAQMNAQRAYSQTAGSIRTPRSVEYEAFARITHRLKSASDSGNMSGLASAIHLNRKLWTLLARDVADADNGLPAELRARIFYLAEFTNEHSRKILRKGASALPLIDLNTAIMRGLQQQENV